ncbi:hypothetical protein AXFE_23130 [Acidithrix ferrooxidans]|uniref:Uncharacterized protein n=1 Tax=Acidithrix ferrooxidans TaxID=1280514 RepID=A0A0D8HG64_9ACTN|nr:hypothetical protein AXFE_23130 [Acidithrix ferrooxidans]
MVSIQTNRVTVRTEVAMALMNFGYELFFGVDLCDVFESLL